MILSGVKRGNYEAMKWWSEDAAASLPSQTVVTTVCATKRLEISSTKTAVFLAWLLLLVTGMKVTGLPGLSRQVSRRSLQSGLGNCRLFRDPRLDRVPVSSHFMARKSSTSTTLYQDKPYLQHLLLPNSQIDPYWIDQLAQLESKSSAKALISQVDPLKTS